MRRHAITVLPWTRCCAVGALLALHPWPPPAQAAATASTRNWHFEVLLDGKPIGWHDFSLTGDEHSGELVSRAHFEVTVLRVPVYRHEHADRERWQDGCLARIDATTSDNGHQLQVRGAAALDGFRVTGPEGTQSWPGCVRSFAYWDRHLIDAQRLLNAQTGEYAAVHVTRMDPPTAPEGGASHYQIEGRGLRIELWYDAAGQWRALETHTGDGRILRYQSPS